jgi:lipid-A-disaccharide synthase
MKNILILAAENSAESYGLQIIDQFKKNHKNIHFFGVGGDRLKNKGVEILYHNDEFAVIGIIEVLSSIFKFRKYMHFILNKAKEKRADAALLIDFPDFNLRLAKKLKKAGIPVYYYIAPTVWAWRYNRVNLIRKFVKHLFIIFPFEKNIYEKENIPFSYTGHPLLSMIRIDRDKAEFRKDIGLNENEILISLLPGSRASEVKFMLPEMLKAVSEIQKTQNIKTTILKAHTIDQNIITDILRQTESKVDIIGQDQGHNLINASDIIITTCGTANLEIAMIGVPFVACYRVNRFSYHLGIHLVKIRLYSIINILAREKVVPELIQKEFRSGNICREVTNILQNKKLKEQMLSTFKRLKNNLGQDTKPAEIVYKKIKHDLSL